MKQQLLSLHNKIFKTKPSKYFFAPGRVNLIGEHTDYSGGYVLPLAIKLGIYAAVNKRKDNLIKVYSKNFSTAGILTVENSLKPNPNKEFINYIQGVIYILKEHGYNVKQGLNITLISDLPVSSGLSSSAAIEILFFKIFKFYNNLKMIDLKIIKMAQQVENEYIGVSSGIMDQYAIVMGKPNQAMFLNTRNLKMKYIPIDLKKYKLVLMNTNKKRDLVKSSYNERFEAVKTASKLLNKSLGEITINEFKQKQQLIKNEAIKKRAKHVITENARVKQAVKSLSQKDYQTFGKLMVASHVSLKQDFEVSCDELDFLVEANLKMNAIGARMTGAGFGGTMIALYENKLPDFTKLKNDYKKRFNKNLDIYLA